jgi:endonuclease YncB( thermonuclease family)
MNKNRRRATAVVAGLGMVLLACLPEDDGVEVQESEQTLGAHITQPVVTTTTVPDITTTTLRPTTTTAPPTTATTTAQPALPPDVHTITNVVDGDTFDISNGWRVRLIGVDTAEVGDCGAAEAAETVRTVTDGKLISLLESPGREPTDNYGRQLRYLGVDIDNDGENEDLGMYLIALGIAKARYDSHDGYETHVLEADYREVDFLTPDVCAPIPPPAPISDLPEGFDDATDDLSGCHPDYDPCLPIVDDLDCPEIGMLVYILGDDPYRLDGRDNDGLGCEAYG